MSDPAPEPKSEPEPETVDRLVTELRVREWLLVAATVMAGLGTIGGWAVATRTDKTFRDQLAVMQKDQRESAAQSKQLVRMVDAATKQASALETLSQTGQKQLGVATQASGVARMAAEQQLREAREEISDQLRARIDAAGSRLHQAPSVGQAIYADTTLRNTGHEAGTNYARQAHFSMLPRTSLSSVRPFLDLENQACRSLPTQDTGRHFGAGDGVLTTDRNWEPQFQQVIDGTAVLVLAGCLRYETRGTIQTQGFCYYYDARYSDRSHFMSQCPGG